MRVFVTGGTGYIGVPVVRELVKRGHVVTLLARDEARVPKDLASRVHVIAGDLSDATALQIGVDQTDAVVHLVGIIREFRRKGVTMQTVHVDGTMRVLEAARRAGVRRFLHMSALGARVGARSGYHRSKWEAETLVRQSGLRFTIFRPSVVFGDGGPGSNFVQELVTLVKRAPILPVIGHGRFPLQPVHTSTVAAVFAQALDMDTTIGETFDVGGPEVVEYGQILQQIREGLGSRKLSIEIPLPIIETLVGALGVMGNPPLTMDQLTMLVEGNVCTNGDRLYDIFDLQPVPFSISRNLFK
ncbi:NAD-dependent nucleoside diphosphate-sugar epimerase/dehydratase [Alicyclobacillus acidoterrestris]|uniref:complex I NDUFA9 subunit family protein n=1 Tax=Alicyclobacillus suci TaxID=2816080 RepID=UPI0011965037|nr:complex I NDUFA9 subunit family protein [Alicyclobacillus suci]GEO27097.1 NAD-dependent nucleoside diphosphate-sugar epimerase/dehydratase [Alicyclobacillus acidoterrestris]